MKPTSQISRPSRRSEAFRPLDHQNKKTPVTDWSFQLPGPNLRGGSVPFLPGANQLRGRPAFHTLSQGFFSAEANRESRFEGALFGVMVALSAWPIVLAAQAAGALLK